MSFQLHAVIQNAADANQIGLAGPIKQDMTRLSDQTIGRSRVATTVAQVIAANAGAEFGPCDTAMA
jgi:hypothetical protein